MTNNEHLIFIDYIFRIIKSIIRSKIHKRKLKQLKYILLNLHKKLLEEIPKIILDDVSILFRFVIVIIYSIVVIHNQLSKDTYIFEISIEFVTK